MLVHDIIVFIGYYTGLKMYSILQMGKRKAAHRDKSFNHTKNIGSSVAARNDSSLFTITFILDQHWQPLQEGVTASLFML